MARSHFTDPLMVSNFALLEVPVAGPVPLAFSFKAVQSAISQGNFIGFQQMSVPEMTLETRDIKQGNWPYMHRVVTGFSSGGEVTLTQAVLPYAQDMYHWWIQSLSGIFGPRRNLIMTHTRPDKSLPARLLSCEGCIPVAYKPGGDFDATASEVSVESMTFWTPKINVIIVPTTPID